MDSLKDLLSAYGPPKPPDEVSALKRYITDEFNVACTIGVQGEALVVTVRSASLANTLRLRITTIQAAVDTKKRLIFRIG